MGSTDPHTPTVASVLFDKGFRTTLWIPRDGTKDDRQTGVLDPWETDPVKRYGNPLGLGCKGWDPLNYCSMHSTGLNSLAPGLAPIVLGVEPSPTDEVDLNFINGATQWILRQANALGLLNPEPADGGDHGSGDHPTDDPRLPKLLKLQADVERITQRAERVALRPQGGGIPSQELLAARQALRKALTAAQ